MAYNRGYVDSIGISRERASPNRVTAVEVKRTRSDLLQDLRKKKLLKYERGSTHCYLAATPEALGGTTKAVVQGLRARGLPASWGVLILYKNKVQCLQQARKLKSVTSSRIRRLQLKMAKSLIYRAIKGTL